MEIEWLPIEQAPKDAGLPLWLWNEEWIDEDFNPTGVMDGYWDELFDDMGGTWVVAGWNSCHDVYDSYAAVPTHFAYKVSPKGNV